MQSDAHVTICCNWPYPAESSLSPHIKLSKSCILCSFESLDAVQAGVTSCDVITWAKAGCLSPHWFPPGCPDSLWPPVSPRTWAHWHTGDTPAPGHRRPGDNKSPGAPSRWWRRTPPHVGTPPCTSCSQCAPEWRGHSPPPARSCRPPPDTPHPRLWAVIMTL